MRIVISWLSQMYLADSSMISLPSRRPESVAKKLAQEIDYGSEVLIENDSLVFEVHDSKYIVSLSTAEVYEDGRKICVICEDESLPLADQAIAKALTIIHKPKKIHTLASTRGGGWEVSDMTLNEADFTQYQIPVTNRSYTGILDAEGTKVTVEGQGTLTNSGPGIITMVFHRHTSIGELHSDSILVQPDAVFTWGTNFDYIHLSTDIIGTEYQVFVDQVQNSTGGIDLQGYIGALEREGRRVSNVMLNEVDFPQFVNTHNVPSGTLGEIITIQPHSGYELHIPVGAKFSLSLTGFGNEVSDISDVRILRDRADGERTMIASGYYEQFKQRYEETMFRFPRNLLVLPGHRLGIQVNPDIEVPRGYIRFYLDTLVVSGIER